MFNTAIMLALSLIHADYNVKLEETDPVVVYIKERIKSGSIHSKNPDTQQYLTIYKSTNKLQLGAAASWFNQNLYLYMPFYKMIQHIINNPGKDYIYTPSNLNFSPFILKFTIPYNLLKNMVDGTIGHEVGHLEHWSRNSLNTYEDELHADDCGTHTPRTIYGLVQYFKIIIMLDQSITIYEDFSYNPLICTNLVLNIAEDTILEMANVYIPKISSKISPSKLSITYHEKVVKSLYNYERCYWILNKNNPHPSHTIRIQKVEEKLKTFSQEEIDAVPQEKIKVSIYKKLTGQLLKEEEL